MSNAGNGITRCDYCGSSCGCDSDCPSPSNIIMDDELKLKAMYRRFKVDQDRIETLKTSVMEKGIENNRLQTLVAKADALAEVILHVEDLREVADFLREQIEEARVSIQEPWRVQFDDFNAAAREMENRTIAFSELYECTEYVSRVDAINAAAKAYQEVRHDE